LNILQEMCRLAIIKFRALRDDNLSELQLLTCMYVYIYTHTHTHEVISIHIFTCGFVSVCHSVHHSTRRTELRAF